MIGTPVIGNLDDDEQLEVVVGSYSSPTSSNELYAVNYDGSLVEGYPYALGEKIKAGAAIADMNDNGQDDIIFGTDSDNIYVYAINYNVLRIMSGMGGLAYSN